MIGERGRLTSRILAATGTLGAASARAAGVEVPFSPTWLEWLLFGVVNLIIVVIYVILHLVARRKHVNYIHHTAPAGTGRAPSGEEAGD